MRTRLKVQSVWILGVSLFICCLLETTKINAQELSKEEALNTAETYDKKMLELYQQGNYEKAIEFAQMSLKLREKHLPPDHPDVALSLNDLARLLELKGDYEGAEPLYRRALEIDEKLLGKEHPSVATSLNGLAVFLYTKRDYEGAEPL
ncbi:MAG: tetratricopeptide repeat protein, partial [Planctomycetota bacterium]